MRIGLVAAMPEECRPLLRRADACSKGKIGRFSCWRFTIGQKEACLIRSGMGVQQAAEATAALISFHRPDLIISFGFGGALVPGLEAGDLVVANRLYCYAEGRFIEQEGLLTQRSEFTLTTLGKARQTDNCQVRAGTFITTDRIENKKDLAKLLPSQIANPVLEMETCAVAQVSNEAGVPLMALRAVSDDANEELGFSIADFTDKNLNMNIPRVLLTLARKPWILPQLLRLWQNTRLAGENLASGIYAALDAL